EFSRSGGDLARVAAALVGLPDAWETPARKLRTPHDWLVASVRALGRPAAPGGLPRALAGLRQPLWAPPAPNGWDDRTPAWSDPDALMNRAEQARTLAAQAGRRAE